MSSKDLIQLFFKVQCFLSLAYIPMYGSSPSAPDINTHACPDCVAHPRSRRISSPVEASIKRPSLNKHHAPASAPAPKAEEKAPLEIPTFALFAGASITFPGSRALPTAPLPVPPEQSLATDVENAPTQAAPPPTPRSARGPGRGHFPPAGFSTPTHTRAAAPKTEEKEIASPASALGISPTYSPPAGLQGVTRYDAFPPRLSAATLRLRALDANIALAVEEFRQHKGIPSARGLSELASRFTEEQAAINLLQGTFDQTNENEMYTVYTDLYNKISALYHKGSRAS